MSIRPPAGGGAGNAYTPGGTDVAVADGGTGSSTATEARTNLGVDYSTIAADAALSGTYASLKVNAGASMSLNADDSVSAGATTGDVSFDVEDYDDAGFIDLGTDATKLTVPTGYGGRYDVLVDAALPAHSSNALSVLIRKNDATIATIGLNHDANSNTVAHAVFPVSLVAGDFLRFRWLNNDGGSARSMRSGTRVALRLVRPS